MYVNFRNVSMEKSVHLKTVTDRYISHEHKLFSSILFFVFRFIIHIGIMQFVANTSVVAMHFTTLYIVSTLYWTECDEARRLVSNEFIKKTEISSFRSLLAQFFSISIEKSKLYQQNDDLNACNLWDRFWSFCLLIKIH